jgi:S1-C subfamily serine protease
MILTNVPGYSLKLVTSIVEFFTSKYTNPEKYEEIKAVCSANIVRKSRPNSHTIQHGYFSVMDFCHYSHEKKELDNLYIEFIYQVLIKLVEHNILWNATGSLAAIAPVYHEFTCHERAKFLFENDLIANAIHEWQFIIDKYSASIFMIEHTEVNGDKSIGTGFLTDPFKRIPMIVTNKHVVEGAKHLCIKNKNDETVNHKHIFEDSKRDLAYIILEPYAQAKTFLFGPTRPVLSEIITIGYPAVPMTRQPYQLCHKGEINSFVKDYQNNDLFLFSAKTSAGNSGSPVIDEYGLIAGIVTQELFEKSDFQNKGRLPYYAAIPANEIIDGINETFRNGIPSQ